MLAPFIENCNNIFYCENCVLLKPLMAFFLFFLFFRPTTLAQNMKDNNQFQEPSSPQNSNDFEYAPEYDLNIVPENSGPKYDVSGTVEDKQHSHGHSIGEELNEEHLKQHSAEEYLNFSKMSRSEIAMHHFRQFDLDANGKVDGLEVLKKIQKDAREDGHKEINVSDTLVNIVDNAIDQYDDNSDGYIYYAEFYNVYKKL